MATILGDFLTALQVPHTETASEKAFRTMPFQSLFGFSRLLNSYGIDSRALKLGNKEDVAHLPTPFLAQKNDAFVIVTSISPGEEISYLRFGERKQASAADFVKDFTGVVLQAFPSPQAAEPDYRRNKLLEVATVAKQWIMWLCVAFLVASAIVIHRLWEHPGNLALLAVDFSGIAVTWMLILKTLKIKNRSADRICAIIKEHGCDTVLEQKASSFFGIFSWSEVGITYFGISTLILLLFPQALTTLGVINLCCLPFTLWSIWYQKFRIHTWCTLCVTTQGLLWLQAGAYLWAGAWNHPFTFEPMTFLMAGATYVATLFAINRVMSFIKKSTRPIS